MADDAAETAMTRILRFACCLLACAGCQRRTPVVTPSPGGEPLPVGTWSDANERDRWHHLSQGSEVYPYRFLKALYLVKEQKPFIDNLERYGFVPDPPSAGNPFGMPVGVTVAPTRDLSFAGVNMVGINCAACHTTVLEKDGQKVLVADGGQNLFDVNRYISELAENTLLTLKDVGELYRFVVRLVRNDDASESERFGGRLLLTGGDPVFRRAATLDDLANQGPLEKALVTKVQEVYQAEMAKPVPSLADKLRTKPPANTPASRLSTYAGEALKAGKALQSRPPDELAREARALRQQVWGDARAGLGNLAAIASLEPAANSPLKSMTPEARAESVGSFLGSIRDVIGLLRARADYLLGLTQRSDRPKTPPGPGRVDAFGSARNAMFPDSPVPLTAPVSFPFLWGVDQVSWYHWDNNTTSALERNVGESVGVGVIYNRTTFESTVRVDNIIELERLAGKLKPPAWPAAAFGAVDAAKAGQGRAIYQRLCASCHEYPVPPTGTKFDDRMYALDAIGTDPVRAENFAIPLGNGSFVDSLSPLLKNIIRVNGGPIDPSMHWRTTRKYGARPLVAVWASAPYLHNNSVPTVYDLLLPADRRPVTFPVGHRAYDPKKLGYDTGTANAPWTFQAKKDGAWVPGNRNDGHSGAAYGTELSDEERYQVIEFLKSQ